MHGIPGDARAAGRRRAEDRQRLPSSTAGTRTRRGRSSWAARRRGRRSPSDERLSEITEAVAVGGHRCARVGQATSATSGRRSTTTSARSRAHRWASCRTTSGHGIGTAMHEAPAVLNYRVEHRGPKVKPGLCVAIEPMLVRGVAGDVRAGRTTGRSSPRTAPCRALGALGRACTAAGSGC